MEENIVKFDIPIYGGQFWICFSDDFIKTCNQIGIELKQSENNCSGLTLKKNDEQTGIFMMLIKNEKVRPDIIAHEALHITNYLFEDRGIVACVQKDEHQAYFLDWIVTQVFKAAYDLKKEITLRFDENVVILLYPEPTEILTEKEV